MSEVLAIRPPRQEVKFRKNLYLYKYENSHIFGVSRGMNFINVKLKCYIHNRPHNYCVKNEVHLCTGTNSMDVLHICCLADRREFHKRKKAGGLLPCANGTIARLRPIVGLYELTCSWGLDHERGPGPTQEQLW